VKVRHTRASVIARVEAEYRSLDKLVRQLEPADFDRPAFAGWTVKDALAHVVAWKAQALRSLRGQRRKPGEGMEVPERNQLIYEAWHERPVAAVVAEHRRVQREVMKALRELPDEFFSGRERSTLWPADLDSHSAEHRKRHIARALAG